MSYWRIVLHSGMCETPLPLAEQMLLPVRDTGTQKKCILDQDFEVHQLF